MLSDGPSDCVCQRTFNRLPHQRNVAHTERTISPARGNSSYIFSGLSLSMRASNSSWLLHGSALP